MYHNSLPCPYCGQSDPDDNQLVEVSHFYEGQDLLAVETRMCDICHKTYTVEVVYKFKYEKYGIGD